MEQLYSNKYFNEENYGQTNNLTNPIKIDKSFNNSFQRENLNTAYTTFENISQTKNNISNFERYKNQQLLNKARSPTFQCNCSCHFSTKITPRCNHCHCHHHHFHIHHIHIPRQNINDILNIENLSNIKKATNSFTNSNNLLKEVTELRNECRRFKEELDRNNNEKNAGNIYIRELENEIYSKNDNDINDNINNNNKQNERNNNFNRYHDMLNKSFEILKSVSNKSKEKNCKTKGEVYYYMNKNDDYDRLIQAQKKWIDNLPENNNIIPHDLDTNNFGISKTYSINDQNQDDAENIYNNNYLDDNSLNNPNQRNNNKYNNYLDNNSLNNPNQRNNNNNLDNNSLNNQNERNNNNNNNDLPLNDNYDYINYQDNKQPDLNNNDYQNNSSKKEDIIYPSKYYFDSKRNNNKGYIIKKGDKYNNNFNENNDDEKKPSSENNIGNNYNTYPDNINNNYNDEDDNDEEEEINIINNNREENNPDINNQNKNNINNLNNNDSNAKDDNDSNPLNERYLIIDENGNPITINGQKLLGIELLPLIGENGKEVIDENGNIVLIGPDGQPKTQDELQPIILDDDKPLVNEENKPFLGLNGVPLINGEGNPIVGPSELCDKSNKIVEGTLGLVAKDNMGNPIKVNINDNKKGIDDNINENDNQNDLDDNNNNELDDNNNNNSKNRPKINNDNNINDKDMNNNYNNGNKVHINIEERPNEDNTGNLRNYNNLRPLISPDGIPIRDSNNNHIFLDENNIPVKDPGVSVLLDQSGKPVLNSLGMPIVIDREGKPLNTNENLQNPKQYFIKKDIINYKGNNTIPEPKQKSDGQKIAYINDDYNNNNLKNPKRNKKNNNEKGLMNYSECNPESLKKINFMRPYTSPYYDDGQYKVNCLACNVGCSVSKSGYSPMNFSPYNNLIRRRDITPIDTNRRKKKKSKNPINLNRVNMGNDNNYYLTGN